MRQDGLTNGFQQARAKRRMNAESGVDDLLVDRPSPQEAASDVSPVGDKRLGLLINFHVALIKDGITNRERAGR